MIGDGSGRRGAALPRRVPRPRLPAVAVPARARREPAPARRDRAHGAAPLHRGRRARRARWCSCSTTCSGPTTTRSRSSPSSRAGLGGSPVVLLAAARPEMLVRFAGVGRRRGRSRAQSTCATSSPTTPSTMFRNLLLARAATVPDGHRRGRGRDDRRQPVLPRAAGPAVPRRTARSTRAGRAWQLDPDRAAATELPISIEEAIEARIAALERDERDLLEKARGVRQRVLAVARWSR